MVCSNSCLYEAKCAVCVLQVIMCRHKGIGMNKPQKSKVEAVVTLKVRLLLRGNVAENLPDEIPAPTFTSHPVAPSSPVKKLLQAYENTALQHEKAYLRAGKCTKMFGVLHKCIRAKVSRMGKMPGARPRKRLREWKAKRAALREERDELWAKENDFKDDYHALIMRFLVSLDTAKSMKIMRLQRLLKLAGGHE